MKHIATDVFGLPRGEVHQSILAASSMPFFEVAEGT